MACLGALMASGQSYQLSADGKTDTYSLIANNGFFVENNSTTTADEYMLHGSYRHISQEYDSKLGEYVFNFTIHVNYSDNGTTVTDGNKGELVDRQRNEIKCMSTVEGTYATDGNTQSYRWKFCLPEGMLTTTAFCHVHQLKGMGSGDNVAHPVITFTCRSVKNSQELQVINVPYEGAANVVLGTISLSTIKGRWIEANESYTVGQHGKYKLTLTDVATGTKLLKIDEDDIAIWRDTDDNSAIRGKWGIYRSLGTDLSLVDQLRTESVKFADFMAAPTFDLSGVTVVASDETNDFAQESFDILGRPFKGRGLQISKNKKTILP
jgi:hypothetical protein